jgi:hypothetical protein
MGVRTGSSLLGIDEFAALMRSQFNPLIAACLAGQCSDAL